MNNAGTAANSAPSPRRKSTSTVATAATEKADKIVSKLLGQAEVKKAVEEKLKDRAGTVIGEVITTLDKLFEGMLTIQGSGTDATINFKQEVIDGFYHADIIEYKAEIDAGKSLNLFEIYYSKLGEVNSYKTVVSSITNRGNDLDISKVKKMTKDNYSPSVLVFWAQHKIHEYVKKQSIDIKDLSFNGVVPIYSVMDFLKREKPLLLTGDGVSQYGGLFKDCRIARTWAGSRFVVQLHNSIFDNGKIVKTETEVSFPLKSYMVSRDTLNFSIPGDEIKATLIERGKKYFHYSMNVSYLNYEGAGIRRSWMGPRSYNSFGRVMVDKTSMKKSDPNYSYYFGEKDDRYNNNDDSSAENSTIDIKSLHDEVLFSASPYVYGFSMKSKQWVEMQIDLLSEIKFVKTAFDDLVLDPGIKDVIRSLVESDKIDYTDIITNKGLGYIFLLSGGPGVGKTLTAEALAETLERPIYYLAVGDLGVDVESLEGKLKGVLEIAETWNAILLIDEIDIFVQKRGGNSDINRNAMTGVFLRLLEYYSGIMFLTTNLIDNLDAAFLSRVSLNIDYGSGLTCETREQIWRNLTKNLDIEGMDCKLLATYELNGRRIKNCIKLMLSLCAYKGLKPTIQKLLEVIKMSENSNEKEGYHAQSGKGK